MPNVEPLIGDANIQEMHGNVYQPPAEIFAHTERHHNTASEQAAMSDAIFIIDPKKQKPELMYPETGGTYMYFIGCKYPKRGVIHPDIIVDLDEAKGFTMSLLSMFYTKDIIYPAVGFALLPFYAPWSIKRKVAMLEPLLQTWCKNIRRRMRRWFLKPERYMTCGQEVIGLIERFLVNIGIGKELAHNVGECLWVLCEYDQQYSMRVLDLFAELDFAAMLKNPGHEIARLVGINQARDHIVHFKFAGIGRIIKILFKAQSIKKAFVKAFAGCKIGRMRPEVGDAYFTLRLSDYDYGGVPFEKRWYMWNQAHTDDQGIPHLPPMIRITAIGDAEIDGELPEEYAGAFEKPTTVSTELAESVGVKL